MGMAKSKNLVGQRFGKLIVIERATSRKMGASFHSHWKCKCDCGNECVASGGNLRRGCHSSCGCKRKSPMAGKRFGRLVVVRRAGSDSIKKNVIWLCKCDCGRGSVVKGWSLRSGRIQSCGCLQKEIIKKTFKEWAASSPDITCGSCGVVIKKTGHHQYYCSESCNKAESTKRKNILKLCIAVNQLGEIL